jgi:uncharacterized lipoprotein
MRWTSGGGNGTVTPQIQIDLLNPTTPMLKPNIALPLFVTVWLLAGCASEPTCNYSKEAYMAAQSVPPLRAPEGLTAPDRSSALNIPPLSEGAKAMPTGESRCLDRPPSYFATAPDKKDKKDSDKKDK